MGVKWFAAGLVALGLVLALLGLQAWNPVAFVGVALTLLGGVVLATRRRGPRRDKA
ncbi:hypothetical protein HOP52_12195 [Halomonas campisalis]|uniref:Uncharacterized protein n=1 Tax=Billgrantia campisalis TaxID=74661 RepID=A0ABS9PAK7_9GAMM|nr:hypothetical protein [Halomonas campisalis]MCG6658514.1 hypothetical protein [Halomonas campisalis]MDR5863375.1 hypothetical protein [Halomonas campisalis]